MIGYVAAGHKAIPPQSEKPPEYPVGREHQTSARKRRPDVGLKLRSGYALPASRAHAFLILFVATLSSCLSRYSWAVAPLATYLTIANTGLAATLLPGLTEKAAHAYFIPVRQDQEPYESSKEKLRILPGKAVVHCDWGVGKVFDYLQSVERFRTDVVVKRWQGNTLRPEQPEVRPQWIAVRPEEKELPEPVQRVESETVPHESIEGLFKWTPGVDARQR